jgi:isopentenyl-diphosphate delta-isomerase
MEQVVLVDENDREVGLMEKHQAHVEGRLHRAFSVLVFNDKNEMLIHKREKNKYHCGGLWTNACCSHPRQNETPADAAKRRLHEEMGFTTDVHFIASFVYKAAFDNGLTEYEFDHLFIGKYNKDPKPNPNEVEDWKYIQIEELVEDVQVHPQKYTAWFITIVKEHLSNALKELNHV